MAATQAGMMDTCPGGMAIRVARGTMPGMTAITKT